MARTVKQSSSQRQATESQSPRLRQSEAKPPLQLLEMLAEPWLSRLLERAGRGAPTLLRLMVCCLARAAVTKPRSRPGRGLGQVRKLLSLGKPLLSSMKFESVKCAA